MTTKRTTTPPTPAIPTVEDITQLVKDSDLSTAETSELLTIMRRIAAHMGLDLDDEGNPRTDTADHGGEIVVRR